MWKQDGEEGIQWKPLTIRGRDIVSLDPRRFHCNCKTDHIQRLIQTHSDASSQLPTLGILNFSCGRNMMRIVTYKDLLVVFE